MRKPFLIVLAVVCATLLGGATASRASQPVWGARAAIVQQGDILLLRSGDFFTTEGQPVTRRLYRLLRDGRPVFGEVPPLVSTPGHRFEGEDVTQYRLRPTDYGHRFQLETYGGVVSDYSVYGHGVVVEWGGKSIQTGETPNRSEVFVPRVPGSLGSPRITETAELTRRRMLAEAEAQIKLWRANGWSEARIARTPIARARAALLRR